MLMQKPMPPTDLKPKVKALYEAVLELLNENADVNTLTVADITKRAGIGKGTAYEYFKCKEEIIAGAVIYDAQKQGAESWDRLEAIPGFEDKIRYCFRWVVECVTEQKAFVRFMFLSVHPGTLRDNIMEKMHSVREASEHCREMGPMTIMLGLCEDGKREGYIREGISMEVAAYMLLGNLSSLVMYLSKEKQSGNYEPEQTSQILCEGFLKAVK